MSFSLASNFFQNARGITFSDANGVTWSFNKNTNVITATVASALGGTVTSVAAGSAAVTIGGTPTVAPTVDLSAASKASLALGASSVQSVGSSNLTVAGTATAPTVSLTSTQVTNIAAAATALQTVAVNAPITGNGTTASKIGLDLTAGYTWTGAHNFTVNTAFTNITVATITMAGGNQLVFTPQGVGASAQSFAQYFSDNNLYIDAPASGTPTGATIIFRTGTSKVQALQLDGSQKGHFAGAIAWNNAAPPAQVTGFGTPVGGAVVASYNITDAGGANSNTNKCVAQILTIMKAHGMLGA